MKRRVVRGRAKSEYVIRLESGEELLAALRAFAAREHIGGAWLWGIGAADDIEIAFYDLSKKRYIAKRFRGRLEIVNITGNIALKDGKPAIHAHGVFSRPNYSVIGGHIFSCRISATCEIYLQKLNPLHRRNDPRIGLNLLY
jgi:predicted DNA-binding protein with PD1-like motif